MRNPTVKQTIKGLQASVDNLTLVINNIDKFQAAEPNKQGFSVNGTYFTSTSGICNNVWVFDVPASVYEGLIHRLAIIWRDKNSPSAGFGYFIDGVDEYMQHRLLWSNLKRVHCCIWIRNQIIDLINEGKRFEKANPDASGTYLKQHLQYRIEQLKQVYLGEQPQSQD